jgi:hypothetical protein
MTDEKLNYREVYALTLEALLGHPTWQFDFLWREVEKIGEEKKRLSPPPTQFGGGVQVEHNEEFLDSFRGELQEFVRQAMWECLVKGILIFGSNVQYPNWPSYRLTHFGKQALSQRPPQPYDPDNFIKYFREHCEEVDPVVYDYLVEAVNCFNSGCHKAAAVMLGCASEKLILLLVESVASAVSDPTKKGKFEKEVNSRWTISHKYSTLKKYLDLMVSSDKLSRDHIETVNGELPAGFQLLRRCRNAGGHPEAPGDVGADTLFMNLRMFAEYASRVFSLIKWFKENQVDW